MTIINHECYVSLEVAKLLKEAGFDWEIKTFYFNNELGEAMLGEAKNHNFSYQFISAPTLAVAQQWLREVKNCSIKIDVFPHNLDKNNIYYTHNWIIYLDGERYSGSNWDDTRYYEVAQEGAIKKALEMISKKA